MKKNKVVSLSLIAIFTMFVIAAFAGCGKNDSADNQNKKQDQTNSQNNDKQNEQKKDVMKTTDTPDNPSAAIAVVRIPTAGCDKCKEIISEALKKVDGVGDFSIDTDRKVAKIKFDMSKTDLSKIEASITAAGFDANDKKADPEAFKKLDDCCKQQGGKK